MVEIERAADLYANTKKAAHEPMISMRERSSMPELEFEQRPLNQHQRQRHSKEGGQEDRCPYASERPHHPAMKNESVHFSLVSRNFLR